MSYLREIEPTHPCDRCDHPLKFHAGAEGNSVCMIVQGKVWHGVVPRGMKAKQCWCDGYSPEADMR